MSEEREIRREKVQILLAEYGSLRSEINARISSVYSAIAVAIFLIVFILQQPIGVGFFIALFVAVAGVGVCGRFLAYDSFSAARRVQEIERMINELVGEKLLVWESDRGGLAKERWRKATMLPL